MGKYESFPGQPAMPTILKVDDPSWSQATVYRRSFKDVTEILAFNEWRPKTHGCREDIRVSRCKGSWFGDESYEAAADNLRNGWRKHVDELAVRAEAINRSIAEMIPTPRPTQDVTGGAIDIGAYLAGEPEHMMTFRREDSPRRAVHIVANVSASGGVDPRTITARGGVIAGLAYGLDRLGVPIKATVYDVATANLTYYIVDLNIKDEGQPLDLGRLAYAIAGPGMLRRIFFGIEENEPPEVANRFGFYAGSYGGVGNIPPAWRGDIYLSAAHWRDSQWHSPKGAVEWVMSQLRSLGVLHE